LVSVSLGFPCTPNAILPKHLSDHCQGLRPTFSETSTKSEAVPLLHPLENHIRPDIQFQIKGHTNRHIHQAAWNLYTDFQDILVLSSLSSSTASRYYNYCADASTSPEKLWIPLVDTEKRTKPACNYRSTQWRVPKRSRKYSEAFISWMS
jgi:hypothetical protein